MRTAGALLAIVALAAVLRLYALDRFPPGLDNDEAYNGLDAQGVLAGNLPIFFEANNGRQPLFIYLQAGAVALFGSTPQALRGTSAVVGIVTVLSIFFLAREMAPNQGRRQRLGLLAAAILAVLYWHVHFSRFGVRPILFALTVTWTLFFFWRAYRGGRWRDYTLAGLAIAASFYTYTASVLLPVPLGGFGLARALQRDGDGRHLVRGFLLAGGSALAVAAPLLLFYLARLDLLIERPSQMFLFNPQYGQQDALMAPIQNAVKAVGMFFWDGDPTWRHGISGWALLDPVSQVLLVAGLGVVLLRWREPSPQLLLLTAGTMLVPAILTGEARHASRAFGSLPAVAVLMALGADFLLTLLAGLPPFRQGAAGSTTMLLGRAVLLAAIGLATFHRYFLVWGPLQETYLAFETDAYEAALYLRRHPEVYADVRTILTSWPPGPPVVLRFLAPEAADKSTLLNVTEAGPHELGPVSADSYPLLYIEPAWPRFAPAGPATLLDVRAEIGPPMPNGEPSFRAFRLDGPAFQARPGPPTAIDARLAQAIELRGANVEPGPPDGRNAIVTLLWRLTRDPGDEPRLFFHLLDSTGRTRGQANFSPRPQYSWDTAGLERAGLVSWFTIPLDPAAPPGDYRVAVGLSRALGAGALPAEARGAPVLAGRVVVGSVELGPAPATIARSALALEREIDQEVAPGLRLAGYRLERHQALSGDTVPLALYWQALRSGLPDYRVAAWPATAGSAGAPAPLPPGGSAFPTSAWRQGEIVEDLRDLRLPAQTPPGEIEIHVAATQPGGNPAGRPLTVAGPLVGERSRTFALPSLACCSVGTRLGGLATIEAFQLGTRPDDDRLWRARPGDALTVTLYWRALGESETSYKVFLHLVSEEGTVVAQHDSPPALGASPTTSWIRDQVVADQHTLALPPALAPGRYRLLTGLYDEATGRRLPSDGRGDTVELATFFVDAP